MDVFLQIPDFESHVPGLDILCEVVQENIANGEHAFYLLDEHLSIIVEHDGTNPFCDTTKSIWCLCFVMSSGDIIPQLNIEDDSPVEFLCLPYGIHIVRLIICEETIDDVTGIWLVTQTSEDDGAHDCAFNLVRYRAS